MTNLNNEKLQLETNTTIYLTEIQFLKTELQTVQDRNFHNQQERELMEMKHAKTVEQVLLDKDVIQRDTEKMISQLKMENHALQGLLY